MKTIELVVPAGVETPSNITPSHPIQGIVLSNQSPSAT